MRLAPLENTATWIDEFLAARKLEIPDGRALYAYRCKSEEFETLIQTLKQASPVSAQIGPIAARAFVFYAAEWWQRRFDGRRWAWEPLLTSISWEVAHYPDLYEPIKAAWGWWSIDLVRLPGSVRYLGTFACQGGLPLALIDKSDNRVTKYLRAVLAHMAAYRQFVEDPIDLARDQQHLLTPPTLRRDYVFRLAADLIEAILNLREDIGEDGNEDVLSLLDRKRPEWRRTMPLALEDTRAVRMLKGLLKEAVHSRSSLSSEFSVERFLRRTDAGWRLGARVRLPASFPTEELARQLKIPTQALPPRLEMRLQGARVRVAGFYIQQSNQFQLAQDTRKSVELWDSEACGEIVLRCLAGGEIGEPIIPRRGSALGALPWAFRSADDGSFIGEGSVSNRAPEIIVLVPDGCTFECLDSSNVLPVLPNKTPAIEPEQVHALNRTIRSIAEPTAIHTDSGCCVIRPSETHAVDLEYRLSGKRFYDIESASALFLETPVLRVARTGQTAQKVPDDEVSWRKTGTGWQSTPDTFGLWDVRHLKDGQLCYLDRVGLLPPQFDLKIDPGTDMTQGHLVLIQAGNIRVVGSGQDSELSVEALRVGGDTRVHVITRNGAAPPTQVALRLHWSSGSVLAVQVPFPGRGGRFLREGARSNVTLPLMIFMVCVRWHSRRIPVRPSGSRASLRRLIWVSCFESRTFAYLCASPV